MKHQLVPNLWILMLTLSLLFNTFGVLGDGHISSMVQPPNSKVAALKRDDEVVKILKSNLSWSVGKGSSLYRWPTDQDAKYAFNQLNEADIPILIKILSNQESSEGVLTSATWILSMFADKARMPVMQAYELASSPQKKIGWLEILTTIEVDMIKQSQDRMKKKNQSPVKIEIQSQVVNNTIDRKRKAEVVKILKDNLTSRFGEGGDKWPTNQDAKTVFVKLTESDIEILVEIIREEEMGRGEIASAKWVLSMFMDKAKILVIQAYELAISRDKKIEWLGVLKSIEVQNIEEHQVSEINK